MEPTGRPTAGTHDHRDVESSELPLDRDLNAPTDAITPSIGAAGTPAEAGIIKGAEGEKEGDPEPIADPLQAAAEINREEEKRGEVRPVDVVPESGDVLPRTSE